MAMTQQQRDERRHEKAAKLQEEDFRLKVRPGTKQALLELMQWSGIEEQGEAMTLMIHHLHALGRTALLKILRHETAGIAIVAPDTLRLTARPGTINALYALAGWSGLTIDLLVECIVHSIRDLDQHQAVKFLTPPKHEIRLSEGLRLAFDRKSMLMIQQSPDDEIISPA